MRLFEAGEPEVLTLREAAKLVRVSERTLGQMARQGRVPCRKVGREWRFLRAALQEWLRSSDAPGHHSPHPQQHDGPEATTGPAHRRSSASARDLGDSAFTENRAEPLHRWVPWIAGFSASFVSNILQSLPDNGQPCTVLEPFAGVGTTLVEGLRRGHNVIGFEINPYAALVCRTKLSAADYDLSLLRQQVTAFSEFMEAHVSDPNASPQSRPPAAFRSRSPFFHPSIERQVLFVKDFIGSRTTPWIRDLLAVALGATLISFSNYSYEPSLCRRRTSGKQDITEADVTDRMLGKLSQIARDIRLLQEELDRLPERPAAEIYPLSFLSNAERIAPKTVDVLITSPPYLNNYHYVRNTRPHLYWLDLVRRPADLKPLEQESFGKFWQTVRAGPRLELALDYPELAELIETVRRLNPDKGVYGGHGWANYATAYFNDCERFCRLALRLMKPGGRAFVVIGNNILQGIEFKTDRFFAGIAERCGFQVAAIHRVRTKRTGSSIIQSSVRVGAAAARVELYESAVELHPQA